MQILYTGCVKIKKKIIPAQKVKYRSVYLGNTPTNAHYSL